MEIGNVENIVGISYEYAKDPYGSIVSLLKRNPVITIQYKDGNTAIIDTNKIYRDGYDDGLKAGQNIITNKIKSLLNESEDDELF